MKRLLPMVLVLFFAACGGGNSGTPDPEPQACGGLCPAEECFFGTCRAPGEDMELPDQGGDVSAPDMEEDAADLAPEDMAPDAEEDLQDMEAPPDMEPDVPTPDMVEDMEPDAEPEDTGDPDMDPVDMGPEDMADPDMADPDMANPDMDPEDMPGPDMGDPDMGEPDMPTPDMGEPDMAPGCGEDGECGAGQICEEGACVAGCRQDQGCALTEICRDAQCVPGCRGDVACPTGQICLDAQCAVGCRQDADCAFPQLCQGNACVGRACQEDQGCLPGSWCDGGACAPGCRDDRECDPGQICDTQTRACEAGCRVDVDCPAGQVCTQEGACEAGCRDDRDCAQGLICTQERLCEPGCRQDEACPQDSYCALREDRPEGSCQEGCRLRQCPALEICALDTRSCQGSQGMCFSDESCGAGQICEPFFCVAGCRQDADCGAGQICEPESLTCVAGCRQDEACPQGTWCDVEQATCQPGCRGDQDCGQGRSCLPDGDARLCALSGCQSDQACPVEQYCDLEAEQCRVGCRDDSGCAQGQVCDLPLHACVEARCQDDQACQPGEICQEGSCEQGCREDDTCPQGSYCAPGAQGPGQCQPGCRPGDCPQGLRCDVLQRFCTQPQCDQDQDCPQGEYCRDSVACAPGCRSDASCGEGEICDMELRQCAPGCGPVSEPDDTCPDPSDLLELPQQGAIEVQGQLCSQDVEHFAVRLAQEEYLQVTAIPGDGLGDLEVELLTQDCQAPVALAGLDGDPYRIGFTAPQEGVYVVRLRNRPRGSSRSWTLQLLRTPPACPLDQEEPNEQGNGLTPQLQTQRGTPLALPGRAICVGDEDWFAVQVAQAGDALGMRLERAQAQAPLMLEVRSAAGVVLAQGSVEGLQGQISTGALSSPGLYFLRVFAQQPVGFSGLRYDLEVLNGPDNSCPEDDLEPNDSFAAAPNVGDGQHALRLCQARGDQEWLRMDLFAGDRVQLSLTYDHSQLGAQDLLAATLYGPGGVEDFRDFTTRQGDSDTDVLSLSPEGFTVRPEDAGSWWLHIEPGGGNQALEVALALSIQAPSCEEDQEALPNNSCATASALALQTDAEGYLCGPASDEDWFLVQPRQGVGLAITLEHLHFEGNLEMEAYNTSNDALLGFSYNAGPNLEEISVPASQTDPVCIRVFARDLSVENRYTLRVDPD